MSTHRLVVVFEPSANGHRLNYVRLLVRHSLKEGATVVVLTSYQAIMAKEWSVQMSALVDQIEVRPLVGGAWGSLRSLKGALRDHGRSAECWVCFPDGDRVLFLAGLLRCFKGRGIRRPHVSLLMMRSPSAASGLARRWSKQFASALAVMVGVDVRLLSLPGGKSSRPLRRTVPDPVGTTRTSFDRAECRTILGWSADRRYIVVPGVFDERKMSSTLLHFVKSDLFAETNWVVVIVGPCRPNLVGPFSGVKNVLIIDDYVSNDELDEYIAAADEILVLNTHNGPSSMVQRAAAAAVPVVTAGAPELETQVEALRAGLYVGNVDSESLVAALKSVHSLERVSNSLASSESTFVRELLPLAGETCASNDIA